MTLSNAAASLTLAGATGNINVGNFGSTSAGTTIYSHVIAGGALNMNSAIGVANTGGLVKADGGTMSLNNRAYYTGTTTINNGTLRLNSGTNNTLTVIPTAGAATVGQVSLNGTGSVLDLMGRNQAIGALTSVNPLPGNGGTVQNTGAAANLTTIGTGVFSGSITGNIALTRAGNNTTTLTSANTYTGATIVRGGVLELRDSGTLSSTAGLTLNYGTLNWNNFGLNAAATPNPTRVAATNAVTLQGGTFTINGAGSTDTIATLNSVTVTGGNNIINTLPFINEGSTVRLNIGNLVRNVATKSGVVFNGFTTNNSTGSNTLGGQGLTTNSNIFLTQVNGAAFSATNLVDNLIGGWAVADGSTFATYSNTFGVVAMGNTYGGFAAPAFTGTDVSAATVATGNYSEGTATRTLTGAKVANSWRFVPGAAQTITFSSGATAALDVGIITNAAFSTTLAATDATNTLTGTGADLFFYINQNTVAIQPAIIGSAALISNGPATLSLRPQFASNTYSGGTFVNAGTLNLQAAATFIAIPGNLTITNGAVTMSTVPNQIAATSAVAINGGGSLTFANYTSAVTTTLASLTFNNAGGAANPTVALGTPTAGNSHTLILTGASPITSTNDSLATTPTISTGSATLTGLQFSDPNPVITVNSGLAETGLTISAPITQHGSMISLNKTGTGVLALSGASTFTTGFNLNQGGLMFGAGSTGSPVITSGPVGTGTLTIAGSTSLLSDGTVRTILNPTTVNGDFTFGGRVAGNGVILSGAMNLGAAARTITVDSPAVTSTISGAITSTASDATVLTKAGAGTLVLSSAASNLGGGDIAVTGGILRNGIVDAIPTASAVAASAGAGYDLNGFAQTLDGISGAGFITNSANSSQTLTVSSTVTNSTFAGALTDNILAQAASRLNLTKAGAGTTLTLSNVANDYSGVTTINGGVVAVSLLADGGLASSIGDSSNAAANLVINGTDATLRYTGTGATNGTTDRQFTLGTAGGTLDASGAVGSPMVLSSTTAPTLSGTDTARTLTLTGSNTGANTLVAPVGDNGLGATSVLKAGIGSWVLTGANTNSGATTMNAGSLTSGASNVISDTSAVVLSPTASNTALLDLAGFNDSILSLTIGGAAATASTVQTGAGTLNLLGDVTYDATNSPGQATISGIVSLGGTGTPATRTFVIGDSTPAVDMVVSAQLIDGTGSAGDSLVKSGPGTLSLTSATSDYTGATSINGGTLAVSKLANGGLISSIGDSTSTASNLVINGGTLAYNGTGDTSDRQFTIGSTATITSSGTGPIALSSTTSPAYLGTDTSPILTLGGSNTGANLLAAPIVDNGTGDTALVKNGTGTWVLSGANAYGGTTTVSQGVLQVGNGTSGAINGTGSVTVVTNGATLATAAVLSGGSGGIAGMGVVAGATTIGDTGNALNLGILAPGIGNTTTSNENMTFSNAGGLTIASGSQVQLGITAATITASSVGTNTGAFLAGLGGTYADFQAYLTSTGSAASYNVAPTLANQDYINVSAGALSLGARFGPTVGEGNVNIFSNGYNLSAAATGDLFNLFDWVGSLAGTAPGTGGANTFTAGGAVGNIDLPTLTGGQIWDTSAFATHGIIVVVPEPSRLLLLMVGLLGLFFRRRRND